MAELTQRTKVPLFLFFLVSGFCGLVYQVVWLRLAFASFGVITPVISVLVSVFMLGLSLGTHLGGKWIAKLSRRTKISAIFYYAVAEGLIGLGAFIVPVMFSAGDAMFLAHASMGSFPFLLISSLVITVSVLPWCVFMGATYPLMTAYLKEINPAENTNFSFLYLANVVGAMFGAATTAVVLVELLGFKGTLLTAACGNFVIAAMSIVLGFFFGRKSVQEPVQDEKIVPRFAFPPITSRTIILLLFVTGLTSMGMEIVWIRAFTPVLGTTVYAFAFLVTMYLFATWLGSYIYRRDLMEDRRRSVKNQVAALAFASLLPVIFSDPRMGVSAAFVLVCIVPFCMILGCLTPRLIDQYSSGNPDTLGRAYAINILGSILGPLVAGYFLLPWIGVKWSLILLSTPFPFLWVITVKSDQVYNTIAKSSIRNRCALLMLWGVGLICVCFFGRTFEDPYFYRAGYVKRDYTATVIAFGQGMKKELLVNGVGMTTLSPMTKAMAHFPSLTLVRGPVNSLIICMGMGTTFRSLITWDGRVTQVELVPSVRDVFGYFFSDAEKVVSNPKARIVIDDGRRFLERTEEEFDLITIDPPPPVEAAGSSLLYSEEFYRLAKRRLSPEGMLTQWYPTTTSDKRILPAIVRSIVKSFKYVRIFSSVEDWGLHFFCSDNPIHMPSVEQAIQRMPVNARKDMMEWYPEQDLRSIVTHMLENEISMSELIPDKEFTGKDTITDDRPLNEYYLLRKVGLVKHN